MGSVPRFLLHHAKQTRSATAMWLLEESQAPYEVRRHELKGPRSPEHLAANPYGKFPTLVDRGPDGTWNSAVTENAAIAMHVADMLPASRLAPKLGDRERGPWVTWCTLLPATLEPGLMDIVFPRKQEAPRSTVGWPPFPETIERITNGLRGKQYLVADRFTAADIVIGSSLAFFKRIGKLPTNEVLDAYLARLEERPALKAAREKD
ncbi:MAG: glutathione S-transferase family protein [Myxococcota bacterium]